MENDARIFQTILIANDITKEDDYSKEILSKKKGDFEKTVSLDNTPSFDGGRDEVPGVSDHFFKALQSATTYREDRTHLREAAREHQKAVSEEPGSPLYMELGILIDEVR